MYWAVLLVRDDRDGGEKIAYDRGVVCSIWPILYNGRIDGVESHACAGPDPYLIQSAPSGFGYVGECSCDGVSFAKGVPQSKGN